MLLFIHTFKPFENFNCKCLNSYGIYNKVTVVTNIYINCEDAMIQLVILYDRHQFLWIGADESQTGIPKWFGDVPRALHKYKLKGLV